MSTDNPTTSSKIHNLPEEVTRVICNAQVVISLAGAARELIDNAIDAGATNIEIRLKENGVDAIEVIDNGKGIDEQDFDVLAKSHCTSKFRDMKDFDNLETFGFRGEALNALTTFSQVVITTKTAKAIVATKLTFDNLSNIVSKQKTAGKTGTTVAVNELFKTLPVRRSELVRNSKKELVKLVNTVQAFALARPDIKFTCSNVIKGKKTPVLTTPGGKATLLDAVATTFGFRAEKDNLLEIIDTIPDARIRNLYGIISESDRIFEVLKISGYISSTESGLGSHTPDRQFIFVNKRHVDYLRAAKLINEVYRSHNKNRYALYVIFIEVHPSRVNVNLTPDKRSIQLRDEPVFLAKLQASLQKAFTLDKATYTPIAKTEGTPQSPSSQTLKNIWDIKKSQSQIEAEDETREVVVVPEPTVADKTAKPRNERMPFGSFGSTLPPNPKDVLPKAPKRLPPTTGEILQKSFASSPAKKQKTFTTSVSSSKSSSGLFKGLWSTPMSGEESGAEEVMVENPMDKSEMIRRMHDASQEIDDSIFDDQEEDVTVITEIPKSSEKKKRSSGETKRKSNDSRTKDAENDDYFNSQDGENVAPDPDIDTNDVVFEKEVTLTQTNSIENLIKNPPDWFYGYLKRTTADNPEGETVRICHEEPRSPCEIGHESYLDYLKLIKMSRTSTSDSLDVSFEDNDSDKIANEEDTKVIIKKEDFNRMKVLWQFNKSFIFCNLDKHIFIVDQHAADEKYNYENYAKNAKLKRQILIKPIALHLSPVQQQVLRNNVDIFLKNGFDFIFNDNEGSNSSISLTSVPNFIGIECGINEIEEIISYLSDDGDFTEAYFRPEKVLKGFASKACRRSVMVGDQLEMKKMQTLVNHLAILDKPWNCPHGRPTVRLLKMSFPLPPPSFEKRIMDELTQQFVNFSAS